MPLPLLDTAVLLRHLTSDHPQHTPRAHAYIAQIEAGHIVVRTTDQVLFEVGYTLARTYDATRTEVRTALLGLIALPGIVMPGKERWRRILDMYVEYRLSIVDAYHVVFMEQHGLTEIVTFDKDFDRIPGITRIEP